MKKYTPFALTLFALPMCVSAFFVKYQNRQRYRILFGAALLVCASVFIGCGKQDKPPAVADTGKISVVTTIFPPYDFTRAVTGGKAEITMLLPPASESHSFEPRPQDIVKIQKSDVFIYTGGESDEWVKEILKSIDAPKLKVVTLMECVETVEEDIVEGMQKEEEDGNEGGKGEEGPEYDEHVWTSPRNAKLITRKISETLREVDSANADAYRKNTEAYLSQLDELDAKFKGVVDGAARKTIVFGDRFPFRYFADAYGLKYFAAFPGCATETEASAKTVAFLIDKMKKETIPVVFHIELSNEKMAQTIGEATGAKARLLHACHNVTKADFEAGKTYVDFMTANVETLREALK
ncbi:MAG: metal ABC transporter substrate-binding protein [Chitinispirillales bacterium]|jgi:zinc transport system substrate-binding protein|nr:metal ABC transporter substrate-binding protein [Chitinispirillales bacterium]